MWLPEGNHRKSYQLDFVQTRKAAENQFLEVPYNSTLCKKSQVNTNNNTNFFKCWTENACALLSAFFAFFARKNHCPVTPFPATQASQRGHCCACLAAVSFIEKNGRLHGTVSDDPFFLPALCSFFSSEFQRFVPIPACFFVGAGVCYAMGMKGNVSSVPMWG